MKSPRFQMVGPLGLLLSILIVVRYLPTSQPPLHCEISTILVAINDRPTKHRPFRETTISHRNLSLLTCMLLLCGDIQQNPGPVTNKHIYSCGLCELPVTWEHVDGLCCDGCDVWHHSSCIELCSADYDLLVKHSHIQRLCCKCENINVSSFTFHSFELNTSNMFDPLSQIDSSIDSISTDMVFSPLFASIPTTRINHQSRSRRSQLSSTSIPERSTNISSLFCVSEKKKPQNHECQLPEH